jgi:hypothetical protein
LGVELPTETIVPTCRLVRSPVFVLSTVRSGSTLLRCLLNTHSRIHAPHELHLLGLHVRAETGSGVALDALGMSIREAEHVLWDRLLHQTLVRSGKQIVADKTPFNVLDWRRVAECWPAARYVFLLRHPLRTLESMVNASRDRIGAEFRRRFGDDADGWQTFEAAQSFLLPMLARLAQARAELPGVTVRYEELTTQPERILQELCAYLDVPWEPEMLNYGRVDHGPFKPFLGDTSDRIQSGRIVAAPRLPHPREIPDTLREACHDFGY